ncbi:hypothetical protein, partial [Enterococcus casseliflavus]|uniref:hypothetical protein n=1 Tax=Enterococcus casseliflavus TaxID=37734 RepID=UPI003D0B3ADB
GPAPRRTIRVVWFGDEETGGAGAKAYFTAHKSDPHILAAESDFGADHVWRVATNFAPANVAIADRLVAALAPLGIVRSRDKG